MSEIPRCEFISIQKKLLDPEYNRERLRHTCGDDWGCVDEIGRGFFPPEELIRDVEKQYENCVRKGFINQNGEYVGGGKYDMVVPKYWS